MGAFFASEDYSVQGFDRSYWARDAQETPLPKARRKDYDLIIIGSGYTGLNTAIEAAPHLSTLIIDAGSLASGCSSRNGGDLCVGGSFLDDATLQKRYGESEAQAFAQLQSAAIDHVVAFLKAHGQAPYAQTEYAYIHSRSLRSKYASHANFHTNIDGLPHAPFGLMASEGYAINPRAYAEALTREAARAGAEALPNCKAQKLIKSNALWTVETSKGQFRAKTILIATNGYSQNGLHPALDRLITPFRSHIIVSEPIAKSALDALGWQAHNPLYDTRTFLHYFRLLPDQCILLGMRGDFSYRADPNFAARIKRDFDQMFPSLAQTQIAYSWSGLIAITRRQTPFCGEILPDLYASFGYHGNGIALGSYCGKMIGRQILGKVEDAPAFFALKPKRFPPDRVMRFGYRASYVAHQLREGRTPLCLEAQKPNTP